MMLAILLAVPRMIVSPRRAGCAHRLKPRADHDARRVDSDFHTTDGARREGVRVCVRTAEREFRAEVRACEEEHKEKEEDRMTIARIRIPPSAVFPFDLSGVKSREVKGQTFGYFASFFAVQSRD